MTVDPDVEVVLEAVRAVLEEIPPECIGEADLDGEAQLHASVLTERQLLVAGVGLSALGRAVAAELRRRRRGEGAHV